MPRLDAEAAPFYERSRGMLVLERKLFEVITIGDNITITVVEIAGSKVKLGIDAPKEVPVRRKEVYEAIRKHDTGEER